MFSLTVIKPNGNEGAIIPLAKKSVVLGNFDTCDIRIKRPNVADRQCEILITREKEAFIKNLNPALPITVDDKLVSSQDYTRLLRNQVIDIDGRKFIVKTANKVRPSGIISKVHRKSMCNKFNQSDNVTSTFQWEVENNENIPKSAGHSRKRASKSCSDTSESNLIEFSPSSSRRTRSFHQSRLSQTPLQTSKTFVLDSNYSMISDDGSQSVDHLHKSTSAFESALDESKDEEDGCITPTNNISVSVESVKRLHSAARKSVLKVHDKSMNTSKATTEYATPNISVCNLVTPENSKNATLKSTRASNCINLSQTQDILNTPKSVKTPRTTPRSILTRSRLSSHFSNVNESTVDRTLPADLIEPHQNTSNITLDRFISSESLVGNSSKSQINRWIENSANNRSLAKPESFIGDQDTPHSTPKSAPKRKSTRKSSSRLSQSLTTPKISNENYLDVQEKCNTPLTPSFNSSITKVSSTPLVVQKKHPTPIRLTKLIELECSPQEKSGPDSKLNSTPINSSGNLDKVFKTPQTLPRINSNRKRKMRSSLKKSLVPEIINLCDSTRMSKSIFSPLSEKKSRNSSLVYDTPVHKTSETITIIDLVTPRESVANSNEKSLILFDNINESEVEENLLSIPNKSRKSHSFREVIDLENASGIDNSFASSTASKKRKSLRKSVVDTENIVLEESLTENIPKNVTFDSENVSGVTSFLEATPNKTYTKNDSKLIVASEEKKSTRSRTKPLEKSPTNNLTDVSGVKNLFATPQNQPSKRKSMRNSTLIETGLDNLFTTPTTEKSVQKGPEETLPQDATPKSNKKIQTPISSTQKRGQTPKNDLPEDEKSLRVTRRSMVLSSEKNVSVSSGRNSGKTPKNDLENLSSVKNLFATPMMENHNQSSNEESSSKNKRKSGRNSTIVEPGLDQLFATPVQEKVENLTLPSSDKLPTPQSAKPGEASFSSSKLRGRTPKNDLQDVSALDVLFVTPQHEKSLRTTRKSMVLSSEKNVTISSGGSSKNLRKTPKNDLENLSSIKTIFATPSMATPNQFSNEDTSFKSNKKRGRNSTLVESGLDNLFATPAQEKSADVQPETLSKEITPKTTEKVGKSTRTSSAKLPTPKSAKQTSEALISSSKSRGRTPKNDLQDVTADETSEKSRKTSNSFTTSLIDGQKSVNYSAIQDFSFDRLFATPQIDQHSRTTRRSIVMRSQEDLSTKSKSRKEKTPKNDLRDVSALDILFATPHNEKSFRTTRKSMVLSSEKDVVSSAGSSRKTPNNDLSHVSSVKTLFTTPLMENLNQSSNEETSSKSNRKRGRNSTLVEPGLDNLFATPAEEKLAEMKSENLISEITGKIGSSKRISEKRGSFKNTPNSSVLKDLSIVSSGGNIKYSRKTSINDVENVSSMKNSFAASLMEGQKSYNHSAIEDFSFDRLFATPQIDHFSRSTRKSLVMRSQEDLSTSRRPRKEKTPKNDLRDVSGLDIFFATPFAENKQKSTQKNVDEDKSPNITTAQDSLANLSGLDTLIASAKKITSESKKIKTKKVQKSPRNDLLDISGVKNLFDSPKTTVVVVEKSTKKSLRSKEKLSEVGGEKESSSVIEESDVDVPRRTRRGQKNLAESSEIKETKERASRRGVSKTSKVQQKPEKSTEETVEPSASKISVNSLPAEVDEPELLESKEDQISEWKKQDSIKTYSSPKKSLSPKKHGTKKPVEEISENVEEEPKQRKTRRGNVQKKDVVEEEEVKEEVKVEKRVTRGRATQKTVEAKPEVAKKPNKRKVSDVPKEVEPEIEEPEVKVKRTSKEMPERKTTRGKKVQETVEVSKEVEEPVEVKETKRTTRRKATEPKEEPAKPTRSTRSSKLSVESHVEEVEKPTKRGAQKKAQPTKDEAKEDTPQPPPKRQTRQKKTQTEENITKKPSKRVQILEPHDLILEAPTTIKKKRMLFTPKKEGIDTNEERHNISIEMFSPQVDPWSQLHKPMEKPKVTRARKRLIPEPEKIEEIVTKTTTKVTRKGKTVTNVVTKQVDTKTESLFSPRKTRSRTNK